MTTIDPRSTDERWRAVPNYEGLYEVSSAGTVRSVDRVVHYESGRVVRWTGRTLVQTMRPDGHVQVTLAHPLRGHRQSKVHAIVASAFLGPRIDGDVIRHLDGLSTNNTVENLAYGSQSENAFDSVRHGTHPQSRKAHCPRGHRLCDPNLRAGSKRDGYRGCLACSRAQGFIQKRPELRGQLQQVADRKYIEIMNGASK